MMRRIAILNQKGGVGKTTTCVNLGAGLARLGQSTLLVDLDPQGHLTLHLGLDPHREPSLYDVLLGNEAMTQMIQPVGDLLSVAGSHIDLAAFEVELADVAGRELRLRQALADTVARFDYVLIDCPPSLGLLTLNALAAVQEVFIPLQPHFLALQGVSHLLETIELVCQQANPQLVVTGVVLCMHEQGTRLASEVVEDLTNFLDAARGQGRPWSGAQIFTTHIRRNIKLAESPSHGRTIFDYAPNCNGAQDYQALAGEVLGMSFGPRMANEQTPLSAEISAARPRHAGAGL
jgi:chromosome partitioning protein